MIFATALPCGPCSAGIETAPTCRPACRCCPPTSVTSTPAAPTGTSPPPPSCWPLSPAASTPSPEHHHERPRTHPAGLLHRTPADPTPGQSQHGRLLPRHLPAAVELRPAPHRQVAVQAATRGPR